MKRAAIISKPGKPELARLARQVGEWLARHDYVVAADQTAREFFHSCDSVEREELARACPDFVVVLGGDGTLLSTARNVAASGVPILGVNLGSLGFLTEVKQEEIAQALEAVDSGRCGVSVRSLLHCRLLRDDQCVAGYEALNDAVVHQGSLARVSDFDVWVDGAFVANYKADGLIISTPTGSTAYSLAAGGPVLAPDVAGFVITPVASHALTNRPLVVRDTAVIDVKVKAGREPATLTVDGQLGTAIREGDMVRCAKSKFTVKLLTLKDRSFFDVLRTKLKWGER